MRFFAPQAYRSTVRLDKIRLAVPSQLRWNCSLHNNGCESNGTKKIEQQVIRRREGFRRQRETDQGHPVEGRSGASHFRAERRRTEERQGGPRRAREHDARLG